MLDQQRLQPAQKIRHPSDAIGEFESESAIRRQLKDDWHRLHPNIRQRFRRDPQPGERIVYEGIMHIVRRSRMGWLFAHLTRIIGNPLTPHAGTDVPVDVTLYKKPGRPGVCWRRVYFYPGRSSYAVTSVKQESRQGEMMECVGGGFGMVLKVFVRNARLHFESTRYFWAFAGLRLPVPHWLSPGTTRVVHEDLGGGAFRFSVSMTHARLGETFYQEGIFRRRDAE